MRLTHLIGHHAIENAAARGGGRIRQRDVELAKERAFVDMGPTYRATIRTLTPNGRTPNAQLDTLLDVDNHAAVHRRRTTAADLIATSRHDPETVLHALQQLTSTGQLATDGTHYRSRIPYISRYDTDEVAQSHTVVTVAL